ncbi:MAG: DMT family transporter [Chitinophagales bacterium]|nr:DMT family transporter [Chitinophagales bacterium]
MKNKPALYDWLMLIVLSLIWGSSFILMKKGLEVFAAPQVAALRVIITALILVPFAFLRRNEVPIAKIKVIFIQGLFGNFIPAFLFTAAQQHIESSLAGILNSLSPVFVFILGIFLFNTKYNWKNITGLSIAFAGVIVLMLFQTGKDTMSGGWYGLLIVMATLCYGISANIIKKYLADVRPLTIVTFAFMTLLFPALICLSFSNVGESFQEGKNTYTALGYISILAIGGSALSSVIYNKLIQRTTALFAASVTYLMPVVALFWGFVAGETISSIDFYGMALIFCGVYLVSR